MCDGNFNYVLEKWTTYVCACTLNAYGSSLTHSVSCVTLVPRGHPSSAIWFSSSHQRWWKAGPWPSTVTDWRGARNSSPWLEACRPRGWRLTGPSYEVLMNGFWHWAGDVCECVCANTWSGFQAPLRLDLSYRGNQGKGYYGHSGKQYGTTSFRSSYTH